MKKLILLTIPILLLFNCGKDSCSDENEIACSVINVDLQRDRIVFRHTGKGELTVKGLSITLGNNDGMAVFQINYPTDFFVNRVGKETLLFSDFTSFEKIPVEYDIADIFFGATFKGCENGRISTCRKILN